MLIPRYWSRAEGQATTPTGRFVRFHVWRGARTSPAEAQALAGDAVQRMADRIRRGDGFPERYTYGDRPLREEVVQEFPSPAGTDAPDAALTRNSYGALVLNAARAFFIDVDVQGADGGAPGSASASAGGGAGPQVNPLDAARELMDVLPIPSGVKSLLGGLFGPPKAAPARPAAPAAPPRPPADATSAAIDRLRAFLSSRPEWRVRVYRTHSGLRYLVTHALFTPESPEAQSAMTALGADPQYVRLCQAQKSFRARLTPKPWRVGIDNPPVGFPYETPTDEAAMRAWEAGYAQASQGRATCQLIEDLGSGMEHPEVAPLRALHDEHTRAGSGLPLA